MARYALLLTLLIALILGFWQNRDRSALADQEGYRAALAEITQDLAALPLDLESAVQTGDQDSVVSAIVSLQDLEQATQALDPPSLHRPSHALFVEGLRLYREGIVDVESGLVPRDNELMIQGSNRVRQGALLMQQAGERAIKELQATYP